ncbi:MAG: hypothetical protein C0502_07860 [Opitutus sp.]|nr:hypothetical protein [Opitutus sp.]
MPTSRLTAAAVLSLALFSGPMAGETTLRVAGSDLLGGDLRREWEGLAAERGVRATFALEGTRPAMEALAAGRADLALLLLPAHEAPPEGDCLSFALAFQAVVFVVPENSPVREMTLAQARGLFVPGESGGFEKWGDFGLEGAWRERPLVLHALAAEAGLAVPLARSLVWPGLELKPAVRHSADNVQLHRRLLAAENALGLTVGAPAERSGLRAVALAANRSEPAYLPTMENLAGGVYPLRLILHLTVRRSALPRLLPLLRILLREEAVPALAAAGFEPLPWTRREELLIRLESIR